MNKSKKKKLVEATLRQRAWSCQWCFRLRESVACCGTASSWTSGTVFIEFRIVPCFHCDSVWRLEDRIVHVDPIDNIFTSNSFTIVWSNFRISFFTLMNNFCGLKGINYPEIASVRAASVRYKRTCRFVRNVSPLISGLILWESALVCGEQRHIWDKGLQFKSVSDLDRRAKSQNWCK